MNVICADHLSFSKDWFPAKDMHFAIFIQGDKTYFTHVFLQKIVLKVFFDHNYSMNCSRNNKPDLNLKVSCKNIISFDDLPLTIL